MNDLLQLSSVTLKFSGLTALSEVTLGFPPAGIHGIIGPNGAGKSTLFNLVTGIYKPNSGNILFDGVALNTLETSEIVRLGIARTFQNIRLLSHLSVLDNLCVVTAVEREGTFLESFLQLPSAKKLAKNIIERAKAVLELVGLAKASKRYPTALPYGDQRKLEIARALMRNPRLLLLDEPAAGMNSVEKETVNKILRKILDQKITVVVIEHDMKFIMNLCDQITVLNQGKVCASGTPTEIQNNPHVIEIYLGKNMFKSPSSPLR